jgi:hypothetical protein
VYLFHLKHLGWKINTWSLFLLWTRCVILSKFWRKIRDYPSIDYYVLLRLQIAEEHCLQNLCLLLFLLAAVHWRNSPPLGVSTQPIVESAFSLWKSDTEHKLSGKTHNCHKQGVWKNYKNSSQKRTRFLVGIRRLRGGPSEGHGCTHVHPITSAKKKEKLNLLDIYINL